MLYVVDGTGPRGDEDYAREFSKSFCRRIHEEVGADRSWYWRGPETTGQSAAVTSTMVHRRAMNDRHCRPDTMGQPLYLCGYSRGGLICIDAARRLAPTPVRALFLFDAVDRCHDLDGSRIPGNVEAVYHARRDPRYAQRLTPALRAAWNELLVDGAVGLGKLDPVTMPLPVPGANAVDALAFARDVMPAFGRFVDSVISDQTLRWRTRNAVFGTGRSLFGNTGLAWDREGGRIVSQHFMGSHGALGGCPWSARRIPGDAAPVPAIRNWMWKHFRDAGLLRRAAGAADE